MLCTQELHDAAPKRQWRLVEVDASLADVTSHKAHLLRELPACLCHAHRKHLQCTQMRIFNVQQYYYMHVRIIVQYMLHKYAGLLHPAKTLMDLNIGAALWLAARAEGRVRLFNAQRDGGCYWEDGKQYRSEARVVLVGHGADEQAGGYGRHRTRFKKDVGSPLCCYDNPATSVMYT